MLEEYPVTVERSVAWGDMDAFGHVNNVRYFRYFEDARITYFKEIGIYDPTAPEPFDRIGPILAETSCQFKTPLTYPADIIVGARTTDIDGNRLEIAYAIARPGADRLVATGDSTVVTYDYEADHPVDVPEDWRRAIDAVE